MKFLPQRAPIEMFGGGGFRFAAMSHSGSLLITPTGMRAWAPTNLENLTMADFELIIAERTEIDSLIIGTGAKMLRLAPQLIADLQNHGIAFETMSTSSAIHNYNLMLDEGRRVAAALIAVEHAHERAK